jgi:4-amino-4-deoxychorismate lyase
MRQLLLQQGFVQVQPIALSRLADCSAMALCNALMGIVPVTSYAGRALSLAPALQLQQQVDVLLL